ncbi:MAG: BlaI/MecI/CopY family transcriptional regulator [Actinobacteria bacterium]|nr:BlaI/MecI/CopY family transcriptional regulator [Actinomycetota bacterium]
MRVKRRETAIGEGLSPLEIEIMKAAWRNGEITVRNVHEALLADGYIPYTSVMAVINGLVAKSILKKDESFRTYVYKPTMNRDQLAVKIIDDVVDQILEGDPQLLIRHLTGRSEKKRSGLANS